MDRLLYLKVAVPVKQKGGINWHFLRSVLGLVLFDTLTNDLEDGTESTLSR